MGVVVGVFLVIVIATKIKDRLAHPLTRGLNLDDPHTTVMRRQIIREKPFLRRIYEEWYETLAQALPQGVEPVLEIGSGAGFLSDFVPGLITSEVFACPGVRLALDAVRLPFADGALRGIVMTDVLHHISQPRGFLSEAARCVRPGGMIAMIEPWVSSWSRMIYTHLHHEPFQPEAEEWEFSVIGPLCSANGALPWIIFERDRAQFLSEFPVWRIQTIKPVMPFRYLVSGGVSLRSFMPGAATPFWRWIERGLTPWMKSWAMFAEIVLVRSEADWAG